MEEKVLNTDATYYTADVQVGRDIIKDAKFFRFNDDWFDMSKVSWWQKIPYLPRRLWCKIKDICWETRYGFQRMFRGYDFLDVGEMDVNFIKRYTKILTTYRKNIEGGPVNMTHEEWTDIIDEMLYHLYYMVDDNIDAELEKGLPEGWVANGWLPALDTTFDIQTKHKDEFFALFSEYFFYLWN